MRIPIYELPSLRCGFYEVFSDKTKIIFNGYAMIDVQRFNFACFLAVQACWNVSSKPLFSKAEVRDGRMRSFDISDAEIQIMSSMNLRKSSASLAHPQSAEDA